MVLVLEVLVVKFTVRSSPVTLLLDYSLVQEERVRAAAIAAKIIIFFIACRILRNNPFFFYGVLDQGVRN